MPPFMSPYHRRRRDGRGYHLSHSRDDHHHDARLMSRRNRFVGASTTWTRRTTNDHEHGLGDRWEPPPPPPPPPFGQSPPSSPARRHDLIPVDTQWPHSPPPSSRPYYYYYYSPTRPYYYSPSSSQGRRETQGRQGGGESGRRRRMMVARYNTQWPARRRPLQTPPPPPPPPSLYHVNPPRATMDNPSNDYETYPNYGDSLVTDHSSVRGSDVDSNSGAYYEEEEEEDDENNNNTDNDDQMENNEEEGPTFELGEFVPLSLFATSFRTLLIEQDESSQGGSGNNNNNNNNNATPNKSETNDCPICFEPILVTATLNGAVELVNCKHQFHLNCLLQAACHSIRCPLCRQPMPACYKGNENNATWRDIP